MEHFENTHVYNNNTKPKVWWRYVDDIFAIWPHGHIELNDFLTQLNNKEPSIKFTLEIETNNQLPFLDVLVKKSNTGFQTQVYRKKTHTNQYLHFSSNHQTTIKRSIIQTLYNRAKTICSSQDTFTEEVKNIKTALESNSYPPQFIENTINKIEHNNGHTTQQDATQQEQPHSTMTIPYYPGLSETIRRLGNRYNIRTVFKTQNTLRSKLCITKPTNDTQNTKNIVYNIPCICGRSYTGETGRPLEIRKKEHKYNIDRRLVDKSKLAEHILTEHGDHKAQWNQTRILLKEEHTYKRKIKETACILLNGNQEVASSSIDFNRCWLSLLRNGSEEATQNNAN